MNDSSPTPHAVYAIILARGGSKGLPRKNVLPVAGRPCLAWTIDAALEARTVTRVALSTDDPEMLALGKRMGVHVLTRPAPLACDTARVDDAARDAVLQLEREHPRAKIVVILYGNVPLRPRGCIDAAVELLQRSSADSLQTYQPVGKHHPWWTARLDDAAEVRPWEGEVLNHNTFRRQDLPPAYVPDGAVLAVTRRALFHEVPGVQPGPHAFFGRDRRGLINPEGSVVDIDTKKDLLVADALLRERAA
jgi:CMP-N,N'-diacetyllegionaminic acid synthase